MQMVHGWHGEAAFARLSPRRGYSIPVNFSDVLTVSCRPQSEKRQTAAVVMVLFTTSRSEE
ncbi:hypothetical protein, partial [Limimaricola soesokkakensis]|uniref:hypothetical protein n=1 Tax=Limimaricola soesokkakensis TaxID=1343159 RepID=UPI0035124F64